MANSALIQLVEQYRAALLAQDEKALNRLIDAYSRIYARLQDKIDLLIVEIGEKQPTLGQLARMSRYKALLEQSGDELASFQALTRAEIDAAAEVGIQLGSQHGVNMMSYAVSGGPGLSAQFNRLPAEAIRQMLGFLDPAGPLYARLKELAPNTLEMVINALTDGIGLGYNPRKIAATLRNAYGQGLTDSLRMVRTLQLYSYREANRATYLANSDVINGWMWHASLDKRTCISCISQHGKIYPLDKPLNDHYNGRCAAVPVVNGFPIPIDETGEDWFNKQPESVQREMMGRGKFEAWKDGRFTLADVSTEHEDSVYGLMRGEISLKELIGDG